MSSIFYWALSIFLFGLMIIVHELGHFWAARLAGIGVLEFAVGIGPKLWSKISKSGVKYSLRALPLGGYCRFVSEEDGDSADRPDAYYNQTVWKRVLVSVGGPLMNLLSAFAAVFIMLVAFGAPFPQAEPVVDSVEPNLPAMTAGFAPGDRIVGINGREVKSIEEISMAIGELESAEISFDIERDGRQITLCATPRWVESESRYMIGITYQQSIQFTRYGFFPALSQSVLLTGRMSRLLLDAFLSIIRGKEDLSNLSGPIGTVVAIKEQTQEFGAYGYLNFAAFLSMNLAIFNLLPIPGLDGSKLIFLLIEKVRGKRIDPNKEGFVLLLGFGLLLIVMALVVYQDIARLLS